MAFPGGNYAPPSVYTRTQFENPLSGSLDSLKIPVFIGEGNEFLVQRNEELVRGSSSNIDQRRVNEDMTGRAVSAISATGVVTLADWDGVLTKFQVANLPIVTGDNTGTTTTKRTDVSVTVNGLPLVVLSVDGTTGVVELAQAPKAGDVVKVSYFFNRMDTLITDDMSDQVSADPAFVRATQGISDVNAQDAGTETLDLHGDILDPVTGAVTVAANNVLNLVVDGNSVTLTIPANSAYTMVQAGNALAAQAVGTTLTATTFVNNLGKSALQLGADQDITILDGSANAVLGLETNATSSRVKTFYTYQGPIVTGDNGGVTTTDPSHVTVLVNGVQVIPTTVDGSTRAVTLSAAPSVGATVTIRYYFNTWQNTFDYLAAAGVSQISSIGSVPDSSDYTQGADFILSNDRVLWGTAWAVTSTETTVGSEVFDETQIQGTLVDNRTYLSVTTPVTSSSGGVSTTSARDFTLPFSPTLGNGRDTPLGSSLFQTIANGRIDIPVNRPDVVTAYWGYSAQDALDRGPLTVVKVEGNVITLGEDVPPGATCYATFYYNRLVDETYSVVNTLAGASGLGTYTVSKADGSSVFGLSYSTASKGAALAGTTVVFPSGSELSPDLRHEVSGDSLFTGPVEETITLQFETKAATPALWASPGAGPYWFIENQSDRARLNIDNVVGSVDPDMAAGGEAEALGIDLTNPTALDRGFFATLVSDRIVYTGEPAGGAGSSVVGESYTLTAPEDLVLFIDGVQVDVTVPATAAAGRSTISDIVTAINVAASGFQGAATGGGAATVDISGLGIPNADVEGFYVGWNVTVGTSVLATDGQTLDVITHSSAGVLTVSANWAGGVMAAADTFRLWDPNTQAEMKGLTKFNGATLVPAGGRNLIRFEVDGDTTALTDSGDLTVPIPGSGAYANATDLATAIQSLMNTAAPTGWGFVVEADGDGRLVVKYQSSGNDAKASFRFVTSTVGSSRDFTRLAGFDVGTFGSKDGAYLIEGEVAKFVNSGMTIPGAGTKHLYDRLVLRNRYAPGGGSTTGEGHLGFMELRVGAGSGNTKAGLSNGDFGVGGMAASVRPASLASIIGIAGGQDAVTGDPQVTFYDGTGSKAANDTFSFTVGGVSIEVTFGSSAAGTTANIGPASGTGNGSVADQILDAIAAVAGAPFGAAPAAFAAGMVVDEGSSGIRITSQVSDLTSQVVIETGSANSTIGFTSGASAQRTSVTPKALASALNNHRVDPVASWDAYLQTFATTTGGATPSFVHNAFASTVVDASGSEYLYIESLSQGSSSVVTVRDPESGGVVTDSWLFPGTGLNALDLDGAVGEAGISGFFVTSNKSTGTGSANDSVLNDGVGSDGIVGQTYRDKVTGVTFTILPQNFHNNPTGPWTPYPTGATATLRFGVSKSHTTNANIPVLSIPGLELKVSNTLNVGAGDSAAVQTYERGGEEPAVGDVYYATYSYTKDSFDTAYFTKMAAIEATYGAISSDNPITLAAFLASLNGAVLMGIKQVAKAEGSNYASLDTYTAAITSLEGVQPGQVNPDIIVPLRGDSTDLFTILKKSNEIQSSIRYKSERTSIIGLASGSTAKTAQDLAQTLGSDRMRLVYPDTAIISLTDAFNNTHDEVVDGTMIAAALAGSVVSPNVDVATPWTGKVLVGFKQLGRLLDAIEMNQTAQKGVTVIEERPPFLKVRHGLTTDMSDILHKTPTVRMIADEVQQRSRGVLANFIGVKFLPGILTQVEGRLAMMFKAMMSQQIFAAYTGIKANTSSDDPTTAEVSAFYQPVFPLLYLVLSFHLRASL